MELSRYRLNSIALQISEISYFVPMQSSGASRTEIIMMEEKDISLRIATLRTKKKVSAREMSLAIGQNPNYINHIETGNAIPSLSGLLYICEYFGITMSEFFDFDSDNPMKLNKINEYLRKLNDEQLETIESLVKNLAEK